jgi:fatty-acyl-CoA synthase
VRLPRPVVLLGDSWHPGIQVLRILSAAATRKSASPNWHRSAIHEPINIKFTSGTTGFPKARRCRCQHPQQRLFHRQAMRLTPQDRLCIPVPLYHCFGMVLGNSRP